MGGERDIEPKISGSLVSPGKTLEGLFLVNCHTLLDANENGNLQNVKIFASNYLSINKNVGVSVAILKFVFQEIEKIQIILQHRTVCKPLKKDDPSLFSFSNFE